MPPRAVVLVPGRELASHIISVARAPFADTGPNGNVGRCGVLLSKKPDVVVRMNILGVIFFSCLSLDWQVKKGSPLEGNLFYFLLRGPIRQHGVRE